MNISLSSGFVRQLPPRPNFLQCISISVVSIGSRCTGSSTGCSVTVLLRGRCCGSCVDHLLANGGLDPEVHHYMRLYDIVVGPWFLSYV